MSNDIDLWIYRKIMAEKINEHLNKRDLELILEVNRKSIEIETGVADQYEDILVNLSEGKLAQKICTDQLSDVNDKLDKVIKQCEDINRDIFKIQVLFLTGLFSLIIQVVQLLYRK